MLSRPSPYGPVTLLTYPVSPPARAQPVSPSTCAAPNGFDTSPPVAAAAAAASEVALCERDLRVEVQKYARFVSANVIESLPLHHHRYMELCEREIGHLRRRLLRAQQRAAAAAQK